MFFDVGASLVNLDDGLLWKFADIEVSSGEVYTGQVIGVYNENKFMWNPTEYSRLSIFTCSDSTLVLGEFRFVFTLSYNRDFTFNQFVDLNFSILVETNQCFHSHVFYSTPVISIFSWPSNLVWSFGLLCFSLFL